MRPLLFPGCSTPIPGFGLKAVKQSSINDIEIQKHFLDALNLILESEPWQGNSRSSTKNK